MDSISQKKVIISYFLTSAAIFIVSAFINLFGVFEQGLGDAVISMSVEVIMLVQLIIVLTANLFLHLVFYYGGMTSSPIMKGVGIGVVLGLVYFMISVFAFNVHDINGEPLRGLVGAMSGRIIEYGSGGVLTALISVTDIHKWGLLRAF